MKKLLLCMAIVSSIAVILLGSISNLNAQQAGWGQCGGGPWTGQTTCVSGWTCVYINEFYSQCQPGSSGPVCPPQNCTAGGCGSSSCSIKSPDLPVGGGAEKSVTASAGYYACCYKEEWTGNLFANAYPNSCCN
jgi:hypothetical protein